MRVVSFERSFYRSVSFVQRKILNRCKSIVEDALREEIILTEINWEGTELSRIIKEYKW